ncbi:MAG: hypothetical protein DHS20C20_03910 [Ardenticatenaceae bacterium]|nr:MAG: hypothetical protein DHS20C20_03910 [Ardenticatenaceae bacterium]
MVYLAHDPRIDRQVAVKLLLGQFLSDPKYISRFQREARTIARLDHPVIVPIYDFGEHEGQPFIVMRHMAGGSLVNWIRNGKLPMETAVPIITRIASTLADVHHQGIIHRDLKPSNILLDNRGDAYLSDFGIVKVNDARVSLTKSSIIGTPAYMSPEQIRNDDSLDHRTDIYALGVILFELLTGKRPFQGETAIEQMVAHATEPIPNIYDFNQDLPPGVNIAIQKTLAKEPLERFSSMMDLVHHLDTITHSDTAKATIHPVQTEATATANYPQKPTRRFWFTGVISLIIVVLILIFWPRLLPVGGNNETAVPTEIVSPSAISQREATITSTEIVVETALLSPTDTPPTETSLLSQSPRFNIISIKDSSRLSSPEANLGLGPGQTTLLGIPFEHGWKITTQCELGSANHPTLVSILVNQETAVKAHVLLQAGQGLTEFSGQKIGEFVVIFEDGQSFLEPLILGENIRDWRSAMPTTYVNQAVSPHLQEAWRGKEGNTDGRIDLLTITIPDTLQNQPIREIQINDTSVQTTGAINPCIHLIAVTLESQP